MCYNFERDAPDMYGCGMPLNTGEKVNYGMVIGNYDK